MSFSSECEEMVVCVARVALVVCVLGTKRVHYIVRSDTFTTRKNV